MEILQDERRAPANSGNLFFLWSAVLLVLTGLCFASWIGSFYVVMHPENPKCYRILKRFKKVEPPKRFEVTQAPKGEFLGAAKLLDRYGRLGKLELAKENAELMRVYVMNFRENKRRVAYVAGRFQVVQSYELQASDMFPSGAVAVAQAENLPQVLIEYVFPAAPESVAGIREALTTGAEITLQRSHDLWALIHVGRNVDGVMQFTVVPLPYGGWQLKKSQESFTLKSPEELARDYGIPLNVGGDLPIVRNPRLAEGMAAFREFRRKAYENAGNDQAALAGPELVRFDPESGGSAEEARAKMERGTVLDAPPVPVPAPAPAASVATAVRRPGFARPTPAPAVPLAPRPIVRSLPQQPLIGAAPPVAVAPPPPAAVPVKVPQAATRVLSVSEASQLVGKYGDEESALLSGDFVVTGVLGRRVALRTRESLRDPDADPTKPGNSAALIVVDFPEGTVPPAKDTTFTRDSAHGFFVRDVIRGRNGQITIVAAERAGPQ